MIQFKQLWFIEHRHKIYYIPFLSYILALEERVKRSFILVYQFFLMRQIKKSRSGHHSTLLRGRKEELEEKLLGVARSIYFHCLSRSLLPSPSNTYIINTTGWVILRYGDHQLQYKAF